MFGKKDVCSNAIANKSLDIFSGAKAQIQEGISKIKANKENRLVLRQDLETQLEAVNSEISKDNGNIKLLEDKMASLDKLI